MTDKKSSESRRKLLKSIVAGGGAVVAGKSLPESWSRPVVDSVMLPAHAQTSPPAASPPPPASQAVLIYGANIVAENSHDGQETLHAKIVDTLVPTAEAGEGGPSAYFICIKVIDGVASIVFSPYASISGGYNMVRRGNIALDAEMKGEGTITASYPQDVSPDADCDWLDGNERLDASVRIDASDPEEAMFELQRGSGGSWIPYSVPKSAGCGPEPTLNGDCS